MPIAKMSESGRVAKKGVDMEVETCNDDLRRKLAEGNRAVHALFMKE